MQFVISMATIGELKYDYQIQFSKPNGLKDMHKYDKSNVSTPNG